MRHGAVTFSRWAVALVALGFAAFVAVGALSGPDGDRPAPIEVAGSAVPGGDGALRQVDRSRLQPAGPLASPAEPEAGSTTTTIASDTATTAATSGASTTTTLLPGLGTVPDPVTDPLTGLLGPLPLLGTTTTTTPAGTASTTTTTPLLPGLPPLPLPPLPTVPLLPPLGG